LAGGDTLAQAAESAITKALGAVGDDPPDLLCVFLADEPGPVGDVLAAAGLAGPAVIGAGVRGVLGPDLQALPAESRDPGPTASAWALAGTGLSVRVFHLETMRTGDSLAVLGQPPTGDEAAAMILVADPWTFPVDGFVDQVSRSWPGLPVAGGLAAGAVAGSARLAVGGAVADRGAVGVMIGGDVSVETVVGQGCRPVGPALTVTAVTAGRVTELAGRPAAEVLRKFLAEESGRPFLGLADVEEREEHAFGGFVLRSILGVDEGGLLVNDSLPLGSTVRLHVLDADVAEADLSSLLWEVRQRPWVGNFAGALVVSGSERDEAMFSESGHDARLVSRHWGTAAVAGFVTDGPIGPSSGGNFVHTAAASVLGVGAGSGSG
jgi:small ligand-binding sensory domain FIST